MCALASLALLLAGCAAAIPDGRYTVPEHQLTVTDRAAVQAEYARRQAEACRATAAPQCLPTRGVYGFLDRGAVPVEIWCSGDAVLACYEHELQHLFWILDDEHHRIR